MDKLRKVTEEIVKITDEGTNNYDIYDDILKVLQEEFSEVIEEEDTKDE